jgi:hypothetical protein
VGVADSAEGGGLAAADALALAAGGASPPPRKATTTPPKMNRAAPSAGSHKGERGSSAARTRGGSGSKASWGWSACSPAAECSASLTACV